jgi:hypothetical protein
MNSEQFVPTYRDDVTVTVGDAPPTPIHPWYCATDQCATDLASVLSDLSPAIVEDWPFGYQMGGPVVVSSKVPFFDIQVEAVKVHLNVGQLAQLWSHGYPPSVAEAAARQQIQLTAQGK